ncbi:MAG: TonB-dependent receptor [Leadbetterella sp.]|nr:TonB-dependent receptor [Leadbetterella sp.]
MKKFSALLLLCLVLSLKSRAQQETVTLDLSSAKFDSFISVLEQQTPYTFYYDPQSTDTLSITLRANNLPLKEVLGAVLEPAKLFFAADTERRIFITTNHAIVTQFAYLEQQSNPTTLRLEDYTSREKQADISIENQLFEIGDKNKPVSGRTTLSGHVRFGETGASLTSVMVSVLGQPSGVQTDAFGYYSLTVPEKRSTIVFKRAGLQETSRQVMMYGSGKLDVQMSDQVFALKEVIITGEMGNNINRTRMGVEKLSVKIIKQTPTVLGEADVINVILTLPGVQTVGEASSGFNVRGGATDQNLVLFGDATIFNSSHFFGMFSSFNADAVNQLELYKSSIPAKYGGRIASVLDVSTRQGNKKKLAGSGGIGLLTSRLSLEGPVGKKTAFLVGARSTYSDWLLKRIPNDTYKNSSASFYDGQVVIDHEINEKNYLFLTAYGSSDKFEMSNGVQYGYGNKNLNLKWRHSLSGKLYGTFAVGTDNYDFNVGDRQTALQTYELNYRIGQEFARLDFNHQAGNNHKLTYGLQLLRYRVDPGTISPVGQESLITPKTLEEEQALESAVYVGDIFTVNDRLTLDLGARFSFYNYLGPRTVNYYLDGSPPEREHVYGIGSLR